MNLIEPDAPMAGPIITGGHRALSLASRRGYHLYNRNQFLQTAQSISPAFWLDTVLPALRASAHENVASRLTAAAARSRKNSSIYDTKQSQGPELATEILFDSRLLKPIERNASRISICAHIRKLTKERKPIRLGLPLFSRKPISPLKNRGHQPDLSEITSLVRCYQLARMLSWAHDYGVEFIIFADGHKYRRACGTPGTFVDEYQSALTYWCKALGIDDLVHILRLQDAVSARLGSYGWERRLEVYENFQRQLTGDYGRYLTRRTF